MKKFLQTMYIIVFTVASGFCNSFAQFSNDVDGKLNINDLNGSVNYIYPISSNSIDGFPINVNMSYVDNVLMTSMEHGHIVDSSKHIAFSYQTKTNPLWIIGVNKFAIQVLGNRSHFSHFNKPFQVELINNFIQYNIDYSDSKNWLVNGYDFCNRLLEIHKSGIVDKIQLLKSDGSILELVNKDTNTNETAGKYTGIYFESGINTTGFALVEYDSTYWPQQFKSQVPQDFPKRFAFIPRKLKYYDGDGLEYVFREIVTPYNYFNYTNYDVSSDPNLPEIEDSRQNALPRIFYLTEINSSQRNLLKFNREWHNFDNNLKDYSIGHAPIKEFLGHKFTWGAGNFSIEALGRTIKGNYIEEWIGFLGVDEDFTANFYENNPSLPDNSIFNDPWFTLTAIRDSSNFRLVNFETLGSFNFITKIIDPKLRVTEFNYDSKVNLISDRSSAYSYSSKRLFPRLIKVQEPTKGYKLEYFNDQTVFRYPEFDKYKYYPNNSNIVEKVTLFNNTSFSDSLQKDIYTFSRNVTGNDTCKLAEKITYNYPNNGNYSKKVQNFVKLYETQCLNPDKDIPDSLQKESYPYIVKTSNEELNIDNQYTKSEIHYTYKTVNEICPNNSDLADNKYFLYLVEINNYRDVGYRFANKSLYKSSRIKFDYEFENIVSLYPQNNKIAPSVMYSTFILSDCPTDSIPYISKEEFLNLTYDKKYVNRQDTLWNFYQSKLATFYYQSHGNLATAKDYAVETRADSISIPPIYGLSSGSHLLKGDNSYIGGTISQYQTTFEDDLSHPRRGAILSKYEIGKDGIDTIKVADYGYKAGNYRNLMNSSEDAFGAKKKIFYDYKDIGANWSYPTGNILTDLNNIYSQTLYNQFEEYETPLVTDDYIRKYTPAKGFYTDTLRTYNERTYFGQVAAYIDPNGWIYRKKYDLNGRELYQWHPLDFPENVAEITQSNCERMYDVKTKKNVTKYYLYVEKADSTQFYTEPIVETYLSADTLTNWDARVGKVISDNVISEDSLYYKHLVITEEFKTIIKYTAGEYDKIHDQSTNSASLNLSFLQMIDKGDMTIRIKCDALNFDKWFLLTNDTQDSSEVFVTEEVGGIRVNLEDILSQLKSFNDDETCEFEISTESDEGLLAFQTNADDNGISICTDQIENNYLNDFTFKFEYDDNGRMKRSIAKIDDPTHSNNSPFIQNFGSYGRYTVDLPRKSRT